MALPKINVPRDTITVDDQELEVRGLTRAETLVLNSVIEREPLEADYHVLAMGTGTPLAEAKEWLDNAPLSTSGPIIKRILELSGIAEESPKD
jgi:hypothetical protein